jgi:hypothetical protein
VTVPIGKECARRASEQTAPSRFQPRSSANNRESVGTLTNGDLEHVLDELRSFVRRNETRSVPQGSRTAKYVEPAKRALSAYDASIRSPSRDEHLRALARETRALPEHRSE